jgi:hypothetical protein
MSEESLSEEILRFPKSRQLLLIFRKRLRDFLSELEPYMCRYIINKLAEKHFGDDLII